MPEGFCVHCSYQTWRLSAIRVHYIVIIVETSAGACSGVHNLVKLLGVSVNRESTVMNKICHGNQRKDVGEKWEATNHIIVVSAAKRQCLIGLSVICFLFCLLFYSAVLENFPCYSPQHAS